jgi:hypothetical protein
LPGGWEYGKGCTRGFGLESIGVLGVVLVLASAIVRRFSVATEKKLPALLKLFQIC